MGVGSGGVPGSAGLPAAGWLVAGRFNRGDRVDSRGSDEPLWVVGHFFQDGQTLRSANLAEQFAVEEKQPGYSQ